MFFVHIFTCNCPCLGIRSVIYYACLNTIKYYTVQVTNLCTNASDSQDNHTEVDNIIQMEMTPKIITIRYIKRYKTLATLKFSTAAYRVVRSLYRSYKVKRMAFQLPIYIYIGPLVDQPLAEGALLSK